MADRYKCIQGHFTDKEHNGKSCPYDNISTKELSELARQKIEDAPKYEVIGNIPPVEEATGFADNERLNTVDHKRHAKEMGYKNQKDYEKAACKFFNSNQGELFWGKRRQRFYRYDKKSGNLCVSSNGTIHTFLRYNLKKFNKIKDQEQLYEI